ncbi:MAG: heavy metal translocating P-type ATPase, partial [Caldilineaceae bacterium]
GRTSTRLTLLGLLLILPGLLFDELLPIIGINIESPIFGWMALAALVVAGIPIVRRAISALVINRQITINLLMTIAAVGAVLLGAWTEAGLVMVLFALGEALEGYTAGRARDSLRSLLSLAPDEAIVLRPCIDCQGHMGQEGYTGGPCPWCGIEEQRVPASSVLVGDQVLVRPGDRFPVDGIVVQGLSSVNQAPITGESLPVAKAPGSTIYAGAINGEGALTVEATALAADSTIARIVRLVEQAQERRAPVQSMVDRFAAWYTPAVVLVALLVACLPPLLWGEPFWGAQGWFYRALAILVVACPCALVISTPVTLAAAVGRAARLGMLVKGGEVLQVLSQVSAIAFDKTGTLTQGRPQVQQVRALACEAPGTDGATCAPCDDLLALAHAVERRSEHPLARAVADHAAALGVAGRYGAADSVLAFPGRGVAGVVEGRPVFVGSHAHFDRDVPHADAECATLRAAAAGGQTPLLLSLEGAYAGFILVSDPPRPEARAALDELRALGIEQLVMVTGDESGAAHKVAAALGGLDVRDRVLPDEKVAVVEALKRPQGGGTPTTVAMIGDGVNDAPALAAADVGIAMGAGSAQALETADLVLLADNLRHLPAAIRLARKALRTVRQNIYFSVGLKLVVFALVLAGYGSLWMAVVADGGASLIVTLWGMRLLRYQPFPERRPGVAMPAAPNA